MSIDFAAGVLAFEIFAGFAVWAYLRTANKKLQVRLVDKE